MFARIARVAPGLAFTKGRTRIFLSYVGFRHLWNMTVFSMDTQLFGVFPDTSPPWMMSGSLWIIPIECSFYIVLPIVMVMFELRRSVVPLFFIGLLPWPMAKDLGLNYSVPDC